MYSREDSQKKPEVRKMISEVEFGRSGERFELLNLTPITVLTGPPGGGKRRALKAIAEEVRKSGGSRWLFSVIDRTRTYEGEVGGPASKALEHRREDFLCLLSCLFEGQVQDIQVKVPPTVVEFTSGEQRDLARECSEEVWRMVHLLAILTGASAGDTVTLECPEAGIHYSLFPLLVSAILAAADRGAQVVLITHSNEFAGRLVWEVKEDRAELFCLYGAVKGPEGKWQWRRWDWNMTRRIIERGLSVVG